MTMATAIALALLAAMSAFRMNDPNRRAVMVFISGALAGSGLLSHMLAGEDLVSPTVGEYFGDRSANQAHMAVATALSILLVAAVVWPATKWPPTWLRDAVAAIVFLIAVLTLLCYAYSPGDLSDLAPLRFMSVNTALSLLLLSTSTILARPERGWAQVIASPEIAGRVTRRQMAYTLLPAALGFVSARASQSHLFPPGAATALLVTFSMFPLLWLVLRDGRMLVALDQERAERLRLVQSHSSDLRAQLDAQAKELGESNAKLLAHAEAASARSDLRYQQLFDSIDSGFCVIEMKFDAAGAPVDYRFIETNEAFLRQSGIHDATGRWITDLRSNIEQYWLDLYGQVALTGEPARYENKAMSLGNRWFDAYAFRVGGAPGALVGILFNDVTARRSIETQLQAMNETLEQRVKAGIAEREEVQTALRQSQKMEAIGQLTGGVAHDFNNLLTPILGSLDLLTRREVLGEREHRLINAALHSAERAKTLVQRLLAFARRQPLQPGPLDLGALVTNMAELVASTSGPHIRVDVEVAPDVPPAIGDGNQLEMAILNLCVNARDAMPDGGRLTISVATSQRPPGRPDLLVGSYVRLSVADNGLGLSMVHGLAMQLGGALGIHSVLGLGTRVDLFLRAGDLMPTIWAPTPSEKPPVRAGRVLVVDDQEQVRMTTAHQLQEIGFTTEECESGSLADLRLSRGEQFDLVVTDYLMPGLSGMDLATRLATSRPEIAVLVISGYINVDAIAPGLRFLRKPFLKDELAGAVSGALRDHGSTVNGIANRDHHVMDPQARARKAT